MHIGNALGVPVLAILQSSCPELHLSDQTDFLMISPLKLDCLNCMENLCPKNEWVPPCTAVDPEAIATWANNRLRATQSEDVSAVIPIFKPRVEMLNRCLEAVLPQVAEVVITRERGGVVPSGIITHPKIVHVVKQADRIGFGRNVNFGVRHSRGKYVLVLNDDVHLDRHAVARMMDVMKPGVGIVGMLTYYPDGTIYHAGKARQLGGGIGFPHLDHRKREPSIKQPLEMENTNGASILFRREAYYSANGYDEAFTFYAEDDSICMAVRSKGWKLWYTPLAFGIHETSQELSKVAGIHEIMSQSNQRFGQLWSEYFRHNAKNPGIGNFDYLKAHEELLSTR
jgi:GT2 family glycosyltransferase